MRGGSNRRPSVSSRDSRITHPPTSSDTAAMKRLTKKIHRQLTLLIRIPPTIGPEAIPSDELMVHSPIAAASF